MAKYIVPDRGDKNVMAYTAFALVGGPGAGKTNLAGSLPGAYFLDIEDRAILTGRPRATFTYTAEGYKDFVNELNTVANLRPENDGWLAHPQGFRFNTLIIDTLNEVQRLASIGIPKGYDTRAFYGKLLDTIQYDVLDTLKRANVNVGLIIHSTVRDPDMDKNKVIEREVSGATSLPEAGLALDGGIRERVMRWVCAAWYVEQDQAGNRWLLTTTQNMGSRVIIPKDTFHLGGGKNVQFTLAKDASGNVRPSTNLLTEILSMTSGGIKETFLAHIKTELRNSLITAAKAVKMPETMLAELVEDGELSEEKARELLAQIKLYLPEDVKMARINQVKRAWMVTAQERGILSSPMTPKEKELLLSILGTLNDNIDLHDVDGMIAAGNAKITAYDPKSLKVGA